MSHFLSGAWRSTEMTCQAVSQLCVRERVCMLREVEPQIAFNWKFKLSDSLRLSCQSRCSHHGYASTFCTADGIRNWLTFQNGIKSQTSKHPTEKEHIWGNSIKRIPAMKVEANCTEGTRMIKWSHVKLEQRIHGWLEKEVPLKIWQVKEELCRYSKSTGDRTAGFKDNRKSQSHCNAKKQNKMLSAFRRKHATLSAGHTLWHIFKVSSPNLGWTDTI